MPTEHYYAYVLSHPHAYLPGSYHMHFTDYYFTAVKITDTQSSRIPKLCHTFEYINCSTSMYFASSNIDLDFSTSFNFSRLLKSSNLTPCKLRRQKSARFGYYHRNTLCKTSFQNCIIATQEVRTSLGLQFPSLKMAFFWYY